MDVDVDVAYGSRRVLSSIMMDTRRGERGEAFRIMLSLRESPEWERESWKHTD